MLFRSDADGLQEESLVDPVTGLYNTRGLSRRAREIGSEVVRRRAPLACVVFAAESDPAPGGTADAGELIGTVGGILRQHGRASDAIGRLGDSEYAVIAPHTEERGAVLMVERLERLLQQKIDGGRPAIRLRAGYSVASDLSAARLDAQQVLHQASSALRSLLTDVNSGDNRLRAFEAAQEHPAT